eukprot:9484958-Karenia_brevis.AAC.1
METANQPEQSYLAPDVRNKGLKFRDLEGTAPKQRLVHLVNLMKERVCDNHPQGLSCLISQ